MLENTKIKNYNSFDTTAVLTGEYGSLNVLLKQCLVTGFHRRYITAAEKKEETLILYFEEPHPYLVSSVLRIENLGETYQREFRVNKVTSTSITILLDDSFSEEPVVSVTSSAMLAPLGYQILHEDGGKVVYTSPQWDGCLKIDDSRDPTWPSDYSVFAKVQIATTYSDTDTPLGVFYPTDTSVTLNSSNIPTGAPLRIYTAKASSTSSDSTVPTSLTTPRRWFLIGDDRSFYLFVSPTGSNDLTNLTYNFFGTINCFNKENTYLTDRTLFAIATYVTTAANASVSLTTSNSFIHAQGKSSNFNGVFITASQHETWVTLYGMSGLGQIYSGGSYSTFSPDLSYVGADVKLPIYILVSSGSDSELVGIARGIEWNLTPFVSLTDRREYNYWYYRYSRLYNRQEIMFPSERISSAYVSFEMVEDWL